jgi:hypothetical protein
LILRYADQAHEPRASLQNLLGVFLIVPETGRGNLVFKLLKLGALRLWVKETSAIRRLGISGLRAARATPARRWHQALLCSFTVYR